jgi:hypothetical protein
MSGSAAAIATKTTQKPTTASAAGQKSAAEPEREPKRAARGSLAPSPWGIPADPPPSEKNRKGRPPRLAAPLGVLQPKFGNGAIDDPLEHAINSVADRVMRLSARAVSISSTPQRILRKRMMSEKGPEKENRIGLISAGASPLVEVPTIVRNGLRAPGRPLDAGTRAFFEARFGYDFSRVRIHADEVAAGAAIALNASAFTYGPNIAFGPGQYDPASERGRRLLAHELVHVAQQEGGAGAGPSGAVHEAEADALAAPLAAGQSRGRVALTSASPSLARAPPLGTYVSPYNEALAREIYARLLAARTEAGAVGFYESKFVVAIAAVFDEKGNRIGWIERLNEPGAAHAEELIAAEVRNISASGKRVGYTVLMIDQDPCSDICTPLLKTWAGDPTTGSLRVVTPIRQQLRDPTQVTSARSANKKLRTQDTIHFEPSAPPPNREAALATRNEHSVVRLPLYKEPPRPPGGDAPAAQPAEDLGASGAKREAGSVTDAAAATAAKKESGDEAKAVVTALGREEGQAGNVAASLAGREENQAFKAASETVGAGMAKRLTQAEERRIWEAAAESFSKMAIGATAKRLAAARAPLIGAVFAAPDIGTGAADIAHGNVVMGVGTIGVALIDIASQGLHLTDEFSAGGGTVLALTIQGWCTAMQLGWEMARVGARGQELQAFIKAHKGGLPSDKELMDYYKLNDEAILLLKSDIEKASKVTTADVIARVQELLADLEKGANQTASVDPAEVAGERFRLGRLLASLQGIEADEKRRAAQERAAADEKAKQQRLDRAIQAQKAAPAVTPQQKAALGPVAVGPAGLEPDPQAVDYGPLITPFRVQSYDNVTMENAELVATQFGRIRTNLLARYEQLAEQHFPDAKTKRFQAAIVEYVSGLDWALDLFTKKGSAGWPGTQELKRLRWLVDNDDRNRLPR